MTTTGFLTDFSLREIFQFIEKGNKTGLLTLESVSETEATPSSVHYIWVLKGSLVTAAHQLNQEGLISLIDQYQWVSNRVVTKLAQFCPPDKPLGLYLQSQGALQFAQLEHLFQIQILQQLCALVQLKNAQFRFDQDVTIPGREMTGLSVSVSFLGVILKKIIWLEKLFKSRKINIVNSKLGGSSEDTCNQLRLILDIAFFHSLNFSLFDTNNTLSKLSQVVDWSERPYDLPKSRQAQAMCCVER